MAETIPGGYYLGVDGEPHDANGKKLPRKSDTAVKAEAEKAKEAATTPLAPTGAPLPKAAKRSRAKAAKAPKAAKRSRAGTIGKRAKGGK